MKQHWFEFGRYKLSPSRRLLERDGERVKMSGRPLDLLVALAENAGVFLSNDDLMRLVWGATTVDGGSIRVHMSTLRKHIVGKAAEDPSIVNVTGRGYCLVGDVRRLGDTFGRNALPTTRNPSIFAPLTTVIGREKFSAELVERIADARLISVVGPGGVGKTTVALSVASDLTDRYRDGIHFVDLATVQKPEHVATTLMSVLGAGGFGGDPEAMLYRHVVGMEAILVLDSCEHVIEVVTTLVEKMLRAGPSLNVIATSREPLSVEGEWIRRLQPLETPETTLAISAEHAMGFTAIELFVSRAKANARDFEITDENAGLIAELCLRLDGIPLAIEFAAARIEEFGLEGVAERINDRFHLLSSGRRTALPRHRTLGQTIDWSYELLSVEEAALLRRLSLFLAPFSVDDAAAVWRSGANDETEALLGSLGSKSMLSISRTEGLVFYRLLDMTREYAKLKLDECSETEASSLIHAQRALEILMRAEAEWDEGLSPRWLALFGRRLPDVRRAIAWAFSTGEMALGVRLVAHSSVLFTSLGMVEEHRVDLERAIAHNARLDHPDELMNARMFSSLGNVLYQVQGHLDDDATRRAFANAVTASRSAGDKAYEVRSLSGLSASYIIRGRHAEALALEDQLWKAGAGSEHAIHRTLAHSTFFTGQMARARTHIEAALGLSPEARNIRNAGAQFDHRLVTLRATYAVYLHLVGRPESAMQIVRECVDDVASRNHPISLCHILCVAACPTALALGGVEAARPYIDLLAKTANSHSIAMWQHWAVSYDALVTPRSLRKETQKAMLLSDIAARGVDGTFVEFLSTLGEEFVEPSFVDAALASPSGWCRPELLRVRGEIDLENGVGAERVEHAFRHALELAQVGGMASWELRAAVSLGRILIADNRSAEAASVLKKAISKMEEGHDGFDFKVAMNLLDGCQN